MAASDGRAAASKPERRGFDSSRRCHNPKGGYMSSELRAAAWGYLQRGLSVIALTGKMPNGKVHPHGLHDAISGIPDGPDDDAILKAVFDHPDTTGIGILTSYPYIVVDIDGDEGAEQWYQIIERQIEDMYPDRWVAKTGRGLHIWYADTKPRRTAKLGAKLDLKGEGGYVAAPPSLHPAGHKYEWLIEPGDEPPVEAPAPLIRLLDRLDFEQQRRVKAREMSKRVRHTQFEDGKWWATWGFDGLLKAVAAAAPGNRNATLYWAACVMIEDGADGEDFEQLREAALAAGLTVRETRLTILSARKAATSE